MSPLGLTPKGFGALTILATEGPLSQQRLAQRQGIDRTTMVAVVDELERAGAAAESEQRFLAPLPVEDQQRLKAALRRLLEQ